MAPIIMQTFHPESIPAAISASRSDGEVPALSEQYWDGSQCRVYKVDFLDGESWSVRLPIHVQNSSHDTIISLLRGEQDVLQELGRTDFHWGPKYCASSLTFENSVGFPFIALSWIQGSPLSWSATEPPRPIRDKVLDQIAEIQMNLIECSNENRDTTATQFFSRLTENKLRRVRNGELVGITEKDCFDQKSLLHQVLYPELEETPFAIDHGNLSPLNIIVDSEHNVTGIIGWGVASKAPLQLAGRLPRFLQLSELVLPPSPALQEDRKTYIAWLKSRSPQQAAAWMLLIQTSADVDFRHCLLESMISKGMHQSLAKLGWKLLYHESSY